MPFHAYQSVLNPSGPQAEAIAWLWRFMVGTSAAVFLIVLGFTAVAVLRGRRALVADHNDMALTTAVSAAVTATIVILFGLLAASVWTGRRVAALGATSAVSISIVGHQWWWEIEYEDAMASRRLKTANEIHIP